MENKPVEKKGPEGAESKTPPVSGRPEVKPPTPPTGAQPSGAPAGGKVEPSKPQSKPTEAPKKTQVPTSKSKKKDRVTPAEVNQLKEQLLKKLAEAPGGIRSVELAKTLGVSGSKLTYVAADLLKEGKIKKVQLKDRVIYLTKDAKVLTPDEEREKLFKEIESLLKAAPKGMKLTDIVAKTKHSPQKVVAAMKGPVEKKEIRKVGDNYMLTGKPAAESAKKPTPPEASPKIEPKVAGPSKDEAKVPPKPKVEPVYRPPQKKGGGALAWFAIILAIISIVMWLTSWGKTAAINHSIATFKQNMENKVKMIDEVKAKMYREMDERFKVSDTKILNTYFNQQITDLEAMQSNLDGIARMTDDKDTLRKAANAKAAIADLIKTLKVEYANTVPE